jgi:hypothetical protein
MLLFVYDSILPIYLLVVFLAILQIYMYNELIKITVKSINVVINIVPGNGYKRKGFVYYHLAGL